MRRDLSRPAQTTMERLRSLRGIRRSIAFALFAIILNAYAVPLSAQTDPKLELHECRNSHDLIERIGHCSNVISLTRQRRALEVAYDMQGLALMETQRFHDAVNDFSALIQLNPNIAGYYDNRQNAYRRLTQFSDALMDANRAIQLAPTYSFVYRGRANVYNDMGKFELAIQDYNQAITIAPEDGGLFIDRGKIYRSLHKFKEALSDFSQALQLNTKWTAAMRERGFTYTLMGDSNAAFVDLTAYNLIAPEDEEVSKALWELRQGHQLQDQTVSTPHEPLGSAEAPNGSGEATAMVSMERSGGTFVVPVLINDALSLDFTIDSGAADVSIPADVVMTLVRTGTLHDTDFLGTQTYRLADGSTVPSQTFRIHKLKVGNKTVEDVTGSIAPVAGTLLLGQSFLSRFKSWSIDNQHQKLLLN
jgi:tetratricopeptide (TPR) repeat protein